MVALDVLRVEGLSASIGKARILRDVNLVLSSGERVGLIGPNGAGKTTTLRVLSGLVSGRTAGRFEFMGSALRSDPGSAVRGGLIHVPEGRQLVPGLSVRDNLRLACSAARIDYSDDMARRVLDFFPGLERLYLRKAGGLSGGEQQMAAIARGLIVKPKLLMIDELSLGLSPKTTGDVLAALRESSDSMDVGLLLVDQNVRAVMSLCDRVYVMRHGSTREVEVVRDPGDTLSSELYF